jgi:iron(III) transport system permease protein
VSATQPWKWIRVLGVTSLVVLCVAPVVVLVPAALANARVAAEAVSPRRMGLLLSSLRLASAVLVIDTLVAGAAVLWARSAPRRRAFAVIAIALSAAFVPPVAHAAAWAGVGEMLRRTLGLAVTPLTGLPAAALAQATAFLPMAVAIGLLGVASIDPSLIDAARMQRPDSWALWRVVVPLVAPVALAAGGIAALMSLGDEAVPSAFGVSTAAMELFSSYASDGNAGATLALAWPLVLVATVAALGCAFALRRVSLRPAWGRAAWAAPPRFGTGTRVVLGAGAVCAAGAAAVTVGALVAGAGTPGAAFGAIGSAAPDIGTTVMVAAACGMIAGVIGLAAGVPAGPGSGPSRGVWGLALVAAVVPGPVLGAGLVALYDHAATSAVYDSLAMPVLASLARFAPLAAVAVAIAATRLPRNALDAAVVSSTPTRAFARVVAPLLAGAAVSGGMLVAALSSGELGATLMVLPPGTSTAVVRAFGLLHYGASQEVAAIALAVAAIGVAAALCAWRVARRGWAAR